MARESFFERILHWSKIGRPTPRKKAIRKKLEKSPDRTNENQNYFTRNILNGIDIHNMHKKHPSRSYGELAESTAIQYVQYEPTRKIAFVNFQRGNGNTYAYPNVSPQSMGAWLRAGSKGKFFHRNIKKHAIKGYRAKPRSPGKVAVRVLDAVLPIDKE